MAWAKSWKTRRCCQDEKHRQGRSRVKESFTRQKKTWKERRQEPGVPFCKPLSLSPRFGKCLEPGHWAVGRQPWDYKGEGSEEREVGHSWSHPHQPQKGSSCRADGEEAKDLSGIPAHHGAVFTAQSGGSFSHPRGGCEMLPVSLILSQYKSAHLEGVNDGKHKLDQYFF